MNNRLAQFAKLALWPILAVVAWLGVAQVMHGAAEKQLERDAERTALHWAGLVMSAIPGLDEVFEKKQISAPALDQLKRLRGAGEVFRFKLFDREGRLLLVSDDVERLAGTAAGNQRAPLHDDLAARSDDVRNALLAGRNLIELHRNVQRPDRPAVYSEAYVPMVRDGRTLGVVEVYIDQAARAQLIGEAFRQVALTVAGVLAALACGVATVLRLRSREQRRAEERVRYLARHDVLTGAMNRASFDEALQEAVWRHADGGPGFAVLCVDLDHFKEVNDTLGHQAGDEMLSHVTERLSKLLRHFDVLARLGGDEFAILQSGVARAADVAAMGQRIVDALAAPYELAGHTVQGGGSVGAAVFGVDASEGGDLMHKADLALYRSKTSGRNQFRFYDASMDEELNLRRKLTLDLRQALPNDEFSLQYQPMFGGNGDLVGYEALLRWQHPERGNIPPDQFIPLAEQTGLIEPIGRWVLHKACTEAASWPRQLSVAVNLSAVQFRGDQIVDTVAQALAASGLPARRLELEITESLLISNAEHAIGVLGRLGAMGVRIAMDDFGTGYSSLAYLWRFPFDKVKIDRAFTQNLDKDPKVNVIVRSIVSLAHALNMRVNAEGVETQGQKERLRELGCDELQGFLLGRPGKAQERTQPAQPKRPDRVDSQFSAELV
jgi:diguanylate cyclase (GGDEF)-like protein